MRTIWQNKIDRLIHKGQTQAKIARYCGVQDSTIFHLRKGTTKDPLYSIGCKIDDLIDIVGN